LFAEELDTVRPDAFPVKRQLERDDGRSRRHPVQDHAPNATPIVRELDSMCASAAAQLRRRRNAI
jgi:hypothetical protein